MPKNQETIAEFGEYSTNLMDDTTVLARISKSYDVLNDISIDAKLVNRKIGEHPLAKSHLEYIGEKDLFLFDRGYPSYDLFKEILSKNGHFCARLTIATWNVAKELVESGKQETTALIIPGHGLRKKYKNLNIIAAPIKCRFILVELSTGEKEVLITSLLDEQKYPHNIFKELYHLRWAVEESYKKDKLVLQFENFSGYSLIAIQQDFFATILLGNITAILASGLDDQINQTGRNRKYKYQLNTTTALSKVKDSMAILFKKSNIYDIINKIINAFRSSILPIRPNRRFFRKQRKTYRAYKSYYKTYMTL